MKEVIVDEMLESLKNSGESVLTTELLLSRYNITRDEAKEVLDNGVKKHILNKVKKEFRFN